MGTCATVNEPNPNPRTPVQWLEKEHRYLELLLRAGEFLDESLNYSETLGNVCKAAVQTIADICLVHLGTGDDLHLAAFAHRDTNRTSELREAGEFLRHSDRRAVHPVWEVIATKQPMLVGQVDDDYLKKNTVSDGHERFIRAMGYRSLAIVPLVSRTQGVLGAMTLVRVEETEAPYDKAELRFAGDLARRCASAIAKSMLYAQTVNIATNFQQAALPRYLPNIAGLSLDAIYEPSSKELLVGGDWYDAFPMPDGRIAITIGDVLGHGIAAAVWMGRLRNALRATLFSDPDPARALAVTDQVMRVDSQDEFSTALVAVIDPIHQTMTCASAGHPGPLIWDGENRVIDPFTERTLPLGLRSLGDDVRTSQVVTLRPGCFAAFFTDGLLEWNHDIASAWDKLQSCLGNRSVREAERPAQSIRDTVISGARHEDDVAILTVRVDELVRMERARVY